MVRRRGVAIALWLLSSPSAFAEWMEPPPQPAEYRRDPGVARLEPAPNDPALVVGVWRLEGHECVLHLEPDGRARAQGCVGRFADAAGWRIADPPMGAALLTLFDHSGARIWSGARADNAYRGLGSQLVRQPPS